VFETGDLSTVALIRRLRPDIGSEFPAAPDALVLHGYRVDASEQEVLSAIPTLTLEKVRKFSYPNLFYSEIRSGFVHEGDTTSLGSSHPGGTRTADISYMNVIEKPYRRIHFSVEWLCKVAEAIGRNCASDFYLPRNPLPVAWWLDGGGV